MATLFVLLSPLRAAAATLEKPEYRVGMFGSDPAIAANRAWREHDLAEYTLAVESAPQAVPETLLNALRSWEQNWDAYYAQATAGTKSAATEEARLSRKRDIFDLLVRHCRVRAGNASCEPLKKTFLAATDAELLDLEAAALLTDFFRSQSVAPLLGAGVGDILRDKKFNCAAISTLAVHLMQRVRDTRFLALQLPDHALLALPLTSGETVYFNNAQEFLPRAFFSQEMAITGYPRIANETPHAPASLLASTYVRSGKLAFGAKHLGAAVTDWKTALAIDPTCPTTLNNLGVIFELERNRQEASGLYRRALAVNPYYARAEQNLKRVSAAD